MDDGAVLQFPSHLAGQAEPGGVAMSIATSERGRRGRILPNAVERGDRGDRGDRGG